MESDSRSQLPKRVTIVEVAPRDGLQNENEVLDLEKKIEFINRLADTGLCNIESGSFVKPDRIPQFADSELVFGGIDRKNNVVYSALVPNLEGLERALDAEASEVAIFTSPSETFCQKNIQCSVEESLQRFIPVLKLATKENIKVRAYLSCVMGCPYEGKVKRTVVADLTDMLISMGCYQVSLGDTIGVGTPGVTKLLIQEITHSVPVEKLAVHFHDTRAQALANIYACLELGVSTIDSSVAGLGGCPYVKGTTGNVATEDVLYMLNGLGIQTGVDLDKLIEVGKYISRILHRQNMSKVACAGMLDWQ